MRHPIQFNELPPKGWRLVHRESGSSEYFFLEKIPWHQQQGFKTLLFAFILLVIAALLFIPIAMAG